MYEYAQTVPVNTNEQNTLSGRRITEIRNRIQKILSGYKLDPNIEDLNELGGVVSPEVLSRLTALYHLLYKEVHKMTIGNLHLAALGYRRISGHYKDDASSRSSAAQECLVALEHAAFYFNPDYRGGEPLHFNTYALAVIPRAAMRALNRNREIYDISPHEHLVLSLIEKARTMLLAAYNTQPAWDDICLMASLLQDFDNMPQRTGKTPPGIADFENTKETLERRSTDPTEERMRRKLAKRSLVYEDIKDRVHMHSLQDIRTKPVELFGTGETDDLDFDASETMGQGINTEDQVFINMRNKLLEKIIDKLPYYKQILVRRYFYLGQTQEEIAVAEGLEKYQVASWLKQAVNQIHRGLTAAKYYNGLVFADCEN